MLLGLACAGACWMLSTTEMVRWLENWASDSSYLLRGQRPSTTKVIIVGVDDESLDRLNKPFTFISPELAKVVTYLHDQQAAAVAVDLMVPENVENSDYYMPGQPGDADKMGIAVATAGNVALPEWLLPGGQWLRPVSQWQRPPQEAQWNDLGFVNLSLDSDTFVRRTRLRATDAAGQGHPSLALAALARAEGLDDSWFNVAELALDGRPLPRDSQGMVPINYVGPPGTFPRLPFHAVLDAAEGKQTSDTDWRGAIVLIGVTAYSQQDYHSTPYSNQSIVNILRSFWLDREVAPMPGVEIHANVLATLGDRAFVTTPWWLSAPLMVALNGAVLGALLMRMSLGFGALLAFAHHWAWKLFCLAAFAVGYWDVEMVPVLMLGALVYGSVFAHRWWLMRRMMGMFKSESVARAMENDPGQLDLKGQEREISVMFSDVRNFTAFSENHTPHEVVQLLNAYFGAVVPGIEARGGNVNQYIGDGLMVIFGAPAILANHARRAVEAAIDTIRRVHELQGRWRMLGAEDFRISIGVHTGTVIVGTIGSPKRLDYTAIGDAVNAASRIESANKELHSEILVSQATVDRLSPEDRQSLGLVSPPQKILVKGKQQELLVYPITVTDGRPQLTNQKENRTMKHCLRTLVFAGIAASFGIAAEAAAPVARILEAQGNVTIKPAGGQPRRATVYGSVYEGERLAVGEKASIALGFRGDGHLERLKTPGEATVTAAGMSPRSGVETIAAAQVEKPRVSKWIEEMPRETRGGISVTRSGGEPTAAVSPVDGSTVATTAPTFAWRAVSGATSYRLVVLSGPDREWTSTTVAQSLKYAGKRPLKEGLTYNWEVHAELSDNRQRLAFSGEFTVANGRQMAEASELKELAESQDGAAWALAAIRYSQNDMIAEALALYERLAKLAPDAPAFQQCLAELYLRAGRKAKAADARRRAEELTGRSENGT